VALFSRESSDPDGIAVYGAEYADLRKTSSERIDRMTEYRRENSRARERGILERGVGEPSTTYDYGKRSRARTAGFRHDIPLPLGKALNVKHAYRISGKLPDATVDRRDESASERYRSDAMEKIVWAIIRASRGETQFADGAWDGSEIGSTCFDLYWDHVKQMPVFRACDPVGLVEVQGADDPHDFQRVYRSWDVPLSSLLAEYAGKTVDGTPDGDPVRVGDIEASHSGSGVAMVTVVQLCDREKAVRFIPSCNVKLYEYRHNYGFVPYVVIPNVGPYREVWGWSDYEFVRALVKYIGNLFSREADILRAVANGTYIEKGTGQNPDLIKQTLAEGGVIPSKREGALEPVQPPNVPAFEGEHAARAMDLFKMLGFAPDAAWGNGFSGSGTDRGLMLQPLVEFTAMKQKNWEAGLGRLFSMAYRMIEGKMTTSAKYGGSKPNGYGRNVAFSFTLGPEEPSQPVQNPNAGDAGLGFDEEQFVDLPRTPARAVRRRLRRPLLLEQPDRPGRPRLRPLRTQQVPARSAVARDDAGAARLRGAGGRDAAHREGGRPLPLDQPGHGRAPPRPALPVEPGRRRRQPRLRDRRPVAGDRHRLRLAGFRSRRRRRPPGARQLRDRHPLRRGVMPGGPPPRRHKRPQDTEPKAYQPPPKTGPVPLPPLLSDKPLQDPEQKRRQQARKQARTQDVRTRTIIRRQQTLRSIGLYKGEVDGIWGPQSQHAWSIYVYRRRHGNLGPFVAPAQVDRQARGDVQRMHTGQARAAARQARGQQEKTLRRLAKDGFKTDVLTGKKTSAEVHQLDVARAKRDAHTQLVAEQHHIEQTAAQLRGGNPERLRTMSLNTLTEVVTNPKVGWDWTNSRDVSIVQTWLKDHGQKVEITGVADKQTNAAITAAIHENQVAEQRRAEREIARDFYAGHRLVPGTRPDWWPVAGAVPEPGELLRVLQQGGFSAGVLFRQLVDHSNLPDLTFQNWRDDQLRKLTQKLDPFRIPFIAGNEKTPMLVAHVLNASAAAIPDGKARAEFTAQLDTLLTARNPQDFSRRINAQLALADQKYTEAQAARAKHKPWWGKALEWSAAPGKFLRTAVVADYYMGADLLTEGHLRDRAEYWDWSQNAWHDANPIVRLGGEFLIDPLVYVRPFRLGSTALRFSLRSPMTYGYAIKLGGYTLTESSAANAFRLLNGAHDLGFLSKTVSYEGALWHLPAKAAVVGLAHRTPVVKQAIALKADAVDAAHEAVRKASRHFFAEPKLQRFTGKLPHVDRFKIRSQSRQVLDKALDDATPLIKSRFGGIYRELLASRTSLYSRASGLELSGPGASMLASYMESYRIQTVYQLANSSARDVYQRALSGGVTQTEQEALAAKHGIPADFLSGGGSLADARRSYADSGASRQLLRRIDAYIADVEQATGQTTRLDAQGAARLSSDEFQRIVDGAGLHFGGGADPEVGAEVAKRLAAAQDRFERVIIPLLQRALEADLEAAGETLWDDTGRWAYMRGDTAKGITALAKESFAESNLIDVVNHNFNQPDALRRRPRRDEAADQRPLQSRLHRHIARKEAEGRPFPDDVKSAMFARERKRRRGRLRLRRRPLPRRRQPRRARQPLLEELKLPARQRTSMSSTAPTEGPGRTRSAPTTARRVHDQGLRQPPPSRRRRDRGLLPRCRLPPPRRRA
jgi:hypothetical protein